MSDNFIPLDQSTPDRGRWQQDKNQQQRYNNRQQHNIQRRNDQNKWRNSSRCSYGSNSSNSSFGPDSRNYNIDAYIHPSMLQDPWASLREGNHVNGKSK